MGPVTAKITIDAPPERVFEVVADLAMRPAFCDHFMQQFHLQRIGSTGTGAAARFLVDAPMFPIWMETVITDLDPPHLVGERGKGARIDRMPVGTSWELTVAGTNQTEATVSFWTEPDHLLDRLKDRASLAGWYERQWNRALTRLRDLVERDAEIEPLRVAGASRS